MNSADVSTLITLADAALQDLQNYNSTGEIGNVVRSIRVLSTPLMEGHHVAPSLIEVTPAGERYDLSIAVTSLQRETMFSRGERCNKLQRYVQRVRSTLLAYKESLDATTLRVERRIFYSWQATLPNTDNRGFISHCLQKAAKEVNANLEESERKDVAYELDQDTKGVPGSPVIFDSILQKIDQSGVFVADVTLLTKGQSNSNVMVELGYALAKLGKSKILRA